MAKTILNFHFDYLKASLISDAYFQSVSWSFQAFLSNFLVLIFARQKILSVPNWHCQYFSFSLSASNPQRKSCFCTFDSKNFCEKMRLAWQSKTTIACIFTNIAILSFEHYFLYNRILETIYVAQASGSQLLVNLFTLRYYLCNYTN